MDFGMEVGIFLAYAACLLTVFFFGKLLLVPLKLLLKLLISSLLGGVALLIINGIGSAWGIFLPVNVVTAVVTGLAGIPGVIMLLAGFHFFS